MMDVEIKILTTYEELEELNTHDVLYFYPIWLDRHKHPAVNQLSVLIIHAEGIQYIIPTYHSEGVLDLSKWTLGTDVVSPLIRTPSATELYHTGIIKQRNVVGMNSTLFFDDQTYIDFDCSNNSFIFDFYKKYKNYKNLNFSIPLMKLSEYVLQVHYEFVKNDVSRKCSFVGYTPPVASEFEYYYYNLEKNGLAVDSDLIKKHFGEYSAAHIVGGKIYTQYNPYNITGRCSNSFGGINFLALNKKDGSRAAFISRFKDKGCLISMDYESYHLHLIAHAIGYQIPDIPFHEYLGRQYLGVAHLTQDQYDKGKTMTFSYLYGDQRPESPIPFFQEFYKWRDEWWEETQRWGYYVLPSGRLVILDDIPDVHMKKAFNYYVQGLEHHYGMSAVAEVDLYLRSFNKDSRALLYTYDSLLLDMTLDEVRNGTLTDIVHSFCYSGEFSAPVRIHAGKNYNNMKKLELSYTI